MPHLTSHTIRHVRVDSHQDDTIDIDPPELITTRQQWDDYLAQYPLNNVNDMPRYWSARAETYKHTVFLATIDTMEKEFELAYQGVMFAPGFGMQCATEVARRAMFIAVKIKLAGNRTAKAIDGVKEILEMCTGAKVVEVEVEFSDWIRRRAEEIEKELVKAREAGLWRGKRVDVKLTGIERYYNEQWLRRQNDWY